MIKQLSFFALLMTFSLQGLAQTPEFTRQDSLRGSITPERAWWDLTYYDLAVEANIPEKSISGTNLIRYKVLEPHNMMQLDLQPPMEISKIEQDGKELSFEREGNVFWVKMPEQKDGEEKEVKVWFSGKPIISPKPPWDGGLTWTTDANGKPFVATSVQGEGASIWWPNKDHMYDEPDNGMKISLTVPEDLMGVANGRLVDTKHNKKADTKTFVWEVKNPINNYGVNMNIGNYVHFDETYKGEKGELDMDYYVLSNNLKKAKEQFKDARRTIEAFEYWFGPYPFYEDSYKLVEVPYLGMEHQSSVTYGNNYANGYLGRDLSSTGWGMKFDFIIIHESGHEWFANNITYRDAADMWIHESFTAYSESLFLEYHYGKEAGRAYVRGTRLAVQNDRPVIGYPLVNHEGSGDMYYKGANMLNTLRMLVPSDEKWREILRGLNREFYHQTVTSEQIENYLSKQIGHKLKPVFDQYLRTTQIPTLEYALAGDQLLYRWVNVVEDFNLPVKVKVNGEEKEITPATNWNAFPVSSSEVQLEIDPNYYIGTMRVGFSPAE